MGGEEESGRREEGGQKTEEESGREGERERGEKERGRRRKDEGTIPPLKNHESHVFTAGTVVEEPGT